MARVKRTQVTTMQTPAKPATPPPAEKKNGNGHSAIDLDASIRARAYELYERRGRGDGYAMDDWFQAETEVRTRSGRTA